MREWRLVWGLGTFSLLAGTTSLIKFAYTQEPLSCILGIACVVFAQYHLRDSRVMKVSEAVLAAENECVRKELNLPERWN